MCVIACERVRLSLLLASVTRRFHHQQIQPNWLSSDIEMFSLDQILCHLLYTTWGPSMLPWWARHFICMHISKSEGLIWKCNPTKKAFVCIYLEALFDGHMGVIYDMEAWKNWWKLDLPWRLHFEWKHVTFNHPLTSFCSCSRTFSQASSVLLSWFLWTGYIGLWCFREVFWWLGRVCLKGVYWWLVGYVWGAFARADMLRLLTSNSCHTPSGEI